MVQQVEPCEKMAAALAACRRMFRRNVLLNTSVTNLYLYLASKK